MEGDHPLSARIVAEVVLWGGKSQARVLRSVLSTLGARVTAIFDDTPGLASPYPDVPLHPGSAFDEWARTHPVKGVGFAVAVGNPHGRARLRIHQRLAAAGLTPVTVVDPRAAIDATARLGLGCQVYAGAVISADAELGVECIVNSGALVEHEARLGDGVEVAAAAAVLGLARLGDCVTVGVRATVLARVAVGSDSIIGAGRMIGDDLPAGSEAYGDHKRIF